jgi:hypothetical protein
LPDNPDGNQEEIVQALRDAGVTVVIIGRPVDLLCGYGGKNTLLECKTKEGKLRESQEEFFANWRGQVTVVRDVQQALDVVLDLDE